MRSRRVFYTGPAHKDQQRLLEFARPDNVLLTNLGRGDAINGRLEAAGLLKCTELSRIIELCHDRGTDELERTETAPAAHA